MIDIQDAYCELHYAQTPKAKYKASLKIIKELCKSGEIANAQNTLDVLTRNYAKQANIPEKKIQKATAPLIQLGYKNSVPRILKSVEIDLESNKRNNFTYLEQMLEWAHKNALESKLYTPRELNLVDETIEKIRNNILDTKAKAQPEDIMDWKVTTLKEAAKKIMEYETED